MARGGERGGIETPEGLVPGFLIAAQEGGEQLAIGTHSVRCSPMAGEGKLVATLDRRNMKDIREKMDLNRDALCSTLVA